MYAILFSSNRCICMHVIDSIHICTPHMRVASNYTNNALRCVSSVFHLILYQKVTMCLFDFSARWFRLLVIWEHYTSAICEFNEKFSSTGWHATSAQDANQGGRGGLQRSRPSWRGIIHVNIVLWTGITHVNNVL